MIGSFDITSVIISSIVYSILIFPVLLNRKTSAIILILGLVDWRIWIALGIKYYTQGVDRDW